MDWPAFWKRLKKEKKITFEAQHKHKKGYLYDIEINGNFIEIEGKEYSCTVVRDIRERKAQEDLMRQHLNEIELYNSTLKNIRDQIFWMDAEGNFYGTGGGGNPNDCKSSGGHGCGTVFKITP